MTKVPFTLLVEDAGDMNIPSGSFDTVIDTFSLCVCDRPGEVLREMARVLRADGRYEYLYSCSMPNTKVY
jgi:ubiquinone/menaquinone biosynthesis C-methylase UbiE